MIRKMARRRAQWARRNWRISVNSSGTTASVDAARVGQRIRFRIGISLGEVIKELDGIFGDGVNIAARLEGVAEVGGISVSEAVATGGADTGFAFLDLLCTEPVRAEADVRREVPGDEGPGHPRPVRREPVGWSAIE
jgi:class 3 adenylate cyclase